MSSLTNSDTLPRELKDVKSDIDSFLLSLRRRQVNGSQKIAKNTLLVLRKIIGKARWSTADELIGLVKIVGKMMLEAHPTELAIGNTVQRVLALIREENKNSEHDEQDGGKGPDQLVASITHSMSLANLFEQSKKENAATPSNLNKLRSLIAEQIGELISDVSDVYETISKQATDHIHANEVVLTFGRSRTVRNFLEEAAKKRAFHLLIAEGAPNFDGQQLAKELANAKLDKLRITVINDSAIFAMMSRVNKVISCAHAVTANGGLISPAGSHMVAQAAKMHSVPYVVCTGLYKLSPLYPVDQDSFNELRSPWPVLNFAEEGSLPNVQVPNPAFDYVPPDLVSVFVTNRGGLAPSYIYRQLAEQFHTDDTLDLDS